MMIDDNDKDSNGKRDEKDKYIESGWTIIKSRQDITIIEQEQQRRRQ